MKSVKIFSGTKSVFRCFVVVPPGLEEITDLELRRLGISGQVQTGGIEFSGGMHDLYRANLWLRTASRILVRLGRFAVTDFQSLVSRVSRLPWELYVPKILPLRVRVTSRRSRLYHTEAVARRIVEGIQERIGALNRVILSCDREWKTAETLVVARLSRDRCIISVDSSGEHLHRRGYRLDSAKAPLRENLAAGILLASEWTGRAPLFDPFCGSGTIPIEAALMARGIAPGAKRTFAFERWRNFELDMWRSLLEQAGGSQDGLSPSIYGSDRDRGAVRAARSNARRAGVDDGVFFSSRAFLSAEIPPGIGWMVTNPPYGTRVGDARGLRRLYAALGDWTRSRLVGWQLALLCPDFRLVRATGLSLKQRLNFLHGGLRVKLFVGKV